MNLVRACRSFYQPCLLKIPTAKYASQHPIKFLETQDRWREKDGLSRKWQLIYKAPMEQMLNYTTAYLTFSTTTMAGCGAYYAAFIFDKSQLNHPVILGEDVVIANSPVECLTYLGAFVLFHVAVKVLLSKYVLRLYQNGDNYLAVFRGHTFNSIKKHEFHLNNFKKLNPTLVVSWGDARFSLGNKHGILLDNYFKTPEHFNYLLNKKKAEIGTKENEENN